MKSALIVDREQRVEITLKDGTKKQSQYVDAQGPILADALTAHVPPEGYDGKNPTQEPVHARCSSTCCRSSCSSSCSSS